MDDEQIKKIVNRFLAWKIPDDFYPDAGISYKPLPGNFSQPTGTNLLDATQAEAMIRHIVGDVVDQAVKHARVDQCKRLDPYIDYEFRKLYEQELATLNQKEESDGNN